MKHSRLELVKSLISANQKRRRYLENEISQPAHDSALAAVIEMESSHPNSIEYSCINYDTTVVEAQFCRLKAWINEMQNKEYAEELKTVLFPLLCHLYMDMLIGGHKATASSFLKKHQNVSNSEESIALLEELATIEYSKEADGKNLARILRSSKYILPLSPSCLQILKQYLARKAHIVLLQIFNDWFSIEEKQLQSKLENENNVSEANGYPEFAMNPTHKMDKELAKVEDIINLVNNGPAAPSPMLVYNIHNPEESLTCARVHTNVGTLAAGFITSEIRLWNLNEKKLKSHSVCPGSRIRLAIDIDTPTSTTSAVNPLQHTLRLNADKLPEADLILRGHSGVVQDVAFVPESDLLVSVSLDKTLRAWNLCNNKCAAIYRGHSYGIWCVDVGPFGIHIATGSHDRTAKLWSLERNYPLRVFAGHIQDVVCLKFHPNGTYLATGSPDKSIRLWSISSGELVRVLPGHRSTILALAFSPNGSYLATAGDDKRIKVWDLAASNVVTELKGHTDSVLSLDWSIDGEFLVSSGWDNTARVWPINQMLKCREEEAGSTSLPRIYSQNCNSLCCTMYSNKNTPVCIIGSC